MRVIICQIAGAVCLASTMSARICPAQHAPVSLVSRGTALDASFVHVSAVRELPGERVLVLDNGEHRVWLIDLAHRSRSPAASSGIGPLEFDSPIALVGAGPNTVVEDLKGPKLLVFDKTGMPSESFTFESTGATRVSQAMLTFRGGDDAGRLYFEVPGIVIEPTGARGVDSSAILRVDRRTSRLDTISFIHLPAGATRASGGRPGEGFSFVTGVDNPFASHDTWVVAPSGRVAIVHAQPYRVEWISPDRKHALGPVVDVEKIPVTDADIADWLKRTGGGLSAGGGMGAKGQDGARGDARANQLARGGRDDWPATKAPFPRGGALVDPRGNVWVRRTTRAGDGHGRYDVFDESGQLIGKYTLPERTRLVGVGGTNLFVMHETDDGERLEIFRVPSR